MPMGGEMRAHRLKAGRIKAEQYRATGAKIILVPCHNCIDQTRDLIKEYNLDMTAGHYKEFISELMVIPDEFKLKEGE